MHGRPETGAEHGVLNEDLYVVVPFDDGVAVEERASEPLAKEAASHGSLGGIKEVKQPAFSCAGAALKEFKCADGLRIKDHRLRRLAGG